MKAKASRDNTVSDTMSGAADRISEAMLTVMQAFGIRELECRRVKSGKLEKTFAAIKPFDEAPNEIRYAAMAVKDPIADIFLSIGVVKVELEPEGDDGKTLAAGYSRLLEAANGKPEGTEPGAEQEPKP